MKLSDLKKLKWRAIISLVLIYLAVLYNQWWLWGVLLIYWGINDLITGYTWLTETITRRQNPIIFHAIVISWLVWGFYMALFPILY